MRPSKRLPEVAGGGIQRSRGAAVVKLAALLLLSVLSPLLFLAARGIRTSVVAGECIL